MIEIIGLEPAKARRKRPLTLLGEPTASAQGTSAYRSGLERDFYLLAKRHHCVAQIDYEPLVVRYRVDGAKRRYTPDYLIRFRIGTPRPAWLSSAAVDLVVYEIKPRKRLDPDPGNWPLALIAGQRAAHQAAMAFRVVFDDEIRCARAAAAEAWAAPSLRARLLTMEPTRARAILDEEATGSVADLAKRLDLPIVPYARLLDARAFIHDVFRWSGEISSPPNHGV